MSPELDVKALSKFTTLTRERRGEARIVIAFWMKLFKYIFHAK